MTRRARDAPAGDDLRTRLADERGVTLIEVLMAMVILVVGTLGTFDTFIAAGQSITASERVAAMTQVAHRYLASAEALPYANIAGSATPSKTTTTDTTNPTYYLSSCTGGSCYQWDHSNPATTELLDVNPTNGGIAAGPANVVVPAPAVGACATSATATCKFAMSVYVFVSETTDSSCGQGGVTCGSTVSYKRITVAVKNLDSGPPFQPVYVSTFVSDKVGGSANPLSSGSTTCLDGAISVSCTH
jgi:prepilin-type N-terminal cleavage/methylation domain-containing protein